MAALLVVNPTADDDRLEFRSTDDAWYEVDLSRDGDQLIIKYRSLSSTFDEVYEPRNFKDVEEVNRFLCRFRLSSVQVQDDECRKIVLGIKICAACSFENDDLRYFDAIVEKVNKKKHIFRDGEECRCSFKLSWLDGPYAGKMMTVGIDSLCFLRDGELEQTLVDFVRMAKMSVMNSSKDTRSLIPVPVSVVRDIGPLITDDMNDPTHGQEVAANHQLQLTSQLLEDQDAYSDKSVAYLTPSIQGRCHYALAIENLEKDLSPSTVTEFIHKETNIIPEAHIFPSLKTDLFTRGILRVHSKSEFNKLLEFLESPDHIVVSSCNRPWVVTERCSGEDDDDDLLVGNSLPTVEHCHDMGSLKVIRSGTDEYDVSKECKQNYTEFNCHQKCVLKRLAFEDEKILSRSSKIRNRRGG